jgi:hypothetical protein
MYKKFCFECGDGFVYVMARQQVVAEGCTISVKFMAVRGIFRFATTAIPALGWVPFNLLSVCPGAISSAEEWRNSDSRCSSPSSSDALLPLWSLSPKVILELTRAFCLKLLLRSITTCVDVDGCSVCN